MGGSKQSYTITFASTESAESIYLTFGNGKYAKNIFRALGVYYEACGYEKELNEQEWYLMLYKRDEFGNVIDEETILFRMYQKQLMWQGQLPEDLAFLEDYIPEQSLATAK